MSVVDVEQEIAPSLKLGDILNFLNDPESGFHREIKASELERFPEAVLISEGKGHCSWVSRIIFSFKDGTKDSVVLKIPTSDIICSSIEDEERKKFTFNMIRVLHSDEIAFLEMLKKYGKNLQMKAPKLYYSKEMTEKDSGLLLIEDFSDEASKEPFTGLKLLTDEQIKQVIVEICKLQALTFQVDKVEDKLVDIDLFYSALTYYAKQYVSRFEKLKIPFITEELLGKIWKLTDRDIEARRNFMKTIDFPRVLIHDDLWPGNILFKENGELCSIVDFQIVSLGCLGEDLANLLSMSLSGRDRRMKEKGFLEFYKNELSKLLPKGNPKTEKLLNMNFEELEKAYNECKKTALIHVIMTLVNYNSQNPGDSDSSETKLEEILRCLLEEVFEE